MTDNLPDLTKPHIEFMAWWKLLNLILETSGHLGCGLSDARGCYDMGETPSKAARHLTKIWLD